MERTPLSSAMPTAQPVCHGPPAPQLTSEISPASFTNAANMQKGPCSLCGAKRTSAVWRTLPEWAGSRAGDQACELIWSVHCAAML